MLTAFIADHGCKPLISTWNLVFLWRLETLPPLLQLLSLYLEAKNTEESCVSIEIWKIRGIISSLCLSSFRAYFGKLFQKSEHCVAVMHHRNCVTQPQCGTLKTYKILCTEL